MGKYTIADPEYRITLEDIEKAIKTNTKKVWVNALIICLYYYGLRISEALALAPRDFKLYTHKKSGRKYLQIRSSTLKNRNNKHRTLYVPTDQPFIEDLYNYAKASHSPRVFEYSRQWARVQIQLLMPQVSPHVFRHNILNDLAQSGLNEFSLESFAGWSDARPAKNYVQKVNARETADKYYPAVQP